MMNPKTQAYLDSYTPDTRLRRALKLASLESPDQFALAKYVVAEAKKGSVISLYLQAVKRLAKVRPDDPDAVADQDWVSQQTAQSNARINSLNTELQKARSAQLRGQIFAITLELATHYEQTGGYETAIEAYQSLRSERFQADNLGEICRAVIRCEVMLDRWQSVLSTAKTFQKSALNDEQLLYVNMCCALAELNLRNIPAAAQLFLETIKPASDIPEPAPLLTVTDVALYGGCLAFATMDRLQLQQLVSGNHPTAASFRPYLDLAPEVRKAIHAFTTGRFKACLSNMSNVRGRVENDLYLGPLAPRIYEIIEVKCLTQLISPFAYVSLDRIQQVFGNDGTGVEAKLRSLILTGDIQARIDAVERMLIVKPIPARTELKNSILLSVESMTLEAEDKIRRIHLQNADLAASIPPSRGSA